MCQVNSRVSIKYQSVSISGVTFALKLCVFCVWSNIKINVLFNVIGPRSHVSTRASRDTRHGPAPGQGARWAWRVCARQSLSISRAAPRAVYEAIKIARVKTELYTRFG